MRSAGKTLGIIGLGNIGGETAKRAALLGMNVIAYDPSSKPLHSVPLVSLDELLASADYISLHLPRTRQSANLIGAEQFARMKTGVRIVNCARGGIINEDALYDALTSGKVAGVALDVFAEEPPTDWKLLKLDNVIGSPHIGASTKEAQTRIGAEVAQIVIEFAKRLGCRAGTRITDSSHENLSRSWHPHPGSLFAQTRRRLE